MKGRLLKAGFSCFIVNTSQLCKKKYQIIVVNLKSKRKNNPRPGPQIHTIYFYAWAKKITKRKE